MLKPNFGIKSRKHKKINLLKKIQIIYKIIILNFSDPSEFFKIPKSTINGWSPLLKVDFRWNYKPATE